MKANLRQGRCSVSGNCFWKIHYKQLLNVEFDWDWSSLSIEPSVEGPAIKMTKDVVAAAVLKMKESKAWGPSDPWRIPDDWDKSTIINCFKGEGDATRCCNYRGFKLLEHTVKSLERTVDAIIRQQVDIDNMQFGFMPGRSTTDAIFILNQMQEKHHLKRKTMYAAFGDPQKTFTESLVRSYGGFKESLE